MGRIATAENAADRENHHRGGSALRFSIRAPIGQSDLRVIAEVILFFPPHDMILVETLPIVRSFCMADPNNDPAPSDNDGDGDGDGTESIEDLFD